MAKVRAFLFVLTGVAMPRSLLVGVLVGLLAGSGGCAQPGLIVRNDRGQAVMVDLQKVRPVEYRKEDLQAAMGLFAEHVASVIQHQEGKLRVRLASTDPMVEAYLAWCGRRHAPGDCLELIDGKSLGISNDGKRSIAVRMALGTALEEVAGVVRNVDPAKVEAVLLIWFTIYFASFVFPDVTITKVLSFVMSANMVAFLGWDGFRSFVLGYRDMCKAADAAQTFATLQDAGRAYGDRMGPSMVRIVTALVTLGLSSATGMSVPVTRLPGGAQAVANAEAMGFRLSAVSSGSVAVSATGTITMIFANQATLPEGGGAAGSSPSNKEGSASKDAKAPGENPAGANPGIAARVRWKGFSKGKLQEHFQKHGAEFGNITQAEYLQAAKQFAAESSPAFQEGQVSNFVVKYDPATRRLLVGHLEEREIRTFYRALTESGDPFRTAMDLARRLAQE